MFNKELLLETAGTHGTPIFVYDTGSIRQVAESLIAQQMPYGLTVRYAIKANPHPEIIKILDGLGLHFDASSTYETQQLLELGISPTKISLSAQTLQGPLATVLRTGILPVATSLHQIEILAEAGVKQLAVRINPGIGSGHSNRTNVGGPGSSFGIWHEYIPQVINLAQQHEIKINRVHTHIGSGADPAIWQQAVKLSLDAVRQLPDATSLDIGGGYKVARMPEDQSTDMTRVFGIFSSAITEFNNQTGRQIKLEIEPGTLLVANSGTLLAQVEDIVDTGTNGYKFLRLNTGMNDILRPSMYGAQHPIEVLSNESEQLDYLVVGHNCESGDILTPAPADPEGLQTRRLNKAQIGDTVGIGGAGAYCASMRAHGYNSFPDAKEVLI